MQIIEPVLINFIKHRSRLLFIYLFLVGLFFVSGCSAETGTDSDDRAGISIARRGVSKIQSSPDSETLTPNGLGKTPIGSQDSNISPMLEITPTTESPSPTTPTSTLLPEETFEVTPVTAIPNDSTCEGETNLALEAELIARINQEREKSGVGLLVEQSQLTLAARSQSEDMACNGFFNHDSPINGGVLERMETTGYRFSIVGEIIAGGYPLANEVLEVWLNSPQHRRQILDPNYTQLGVGFVRAIGYGYENYWTVIFASPAP